MQETKLSALLEELSEVESLLELDALLGDLTGDVHTACYAEHPDVVTKVAELRGVLRGTIVEEHTTKEVVQRVVVRAGRKYKLLRTDVGWTTKPQVHALMAILTAHLAVGDVVAESDIVNMVEANAKVLGTRQPPKRIWDYYKGNTGDGLVAHGNMERI